MTPISVARRITAIADVAFRRLSSPLRVMPDFVIIGAQRAGTTSLYHYLIQHPAVIPASKKEVHFFDYNFHLGTLWYRAHFPTIWRRTAMRNRYGVFATGEGSPYYFFHPEVPGRLSKTLPGAKFIILLRNPVDRAYSHYHHEVRRGRELLSFEEAVKKEFQRLEGERKELERLRGFPRFHHNRHSYLSRGIYTEQLKRWLRFFPRDQFLVLNSEFFYRNPVTEVKRTLDFLKLPPIEFDRYETYQKGHYSNMSELIRRDLSAFFEPYNRELFRLLAQEFDWR